MTRIRRMNADAVEVILQRYEFQLISQKAVPANHETLKGFR